ncbi:MAG: hypothetical protein GTN76_08670 [Candidatus Aenigmarchaeota archaeon]|nr:hypothetical protein [Candidatus Aenigmarchaeota archaeon]
MTDREKLRAIARIISQFREYEKTKPRHRIKHYATQSIWFIEQVLEGINVTYLKFKPEDIDLSGV